MKKRCLWINVSLMLALVFAISVLRIRAQTPAAALQGTWEGVLNAGPMKLRLLLNVTKSSDGLYLGTLTSVDQNNARIPIDRMEIDGDSLRLGLKAVSGAYEGTLNREHAKITGTLTQGVARYPLEFTRTASSAEVPTQTSTANSRQADSSGFGMPVVVEVPAAPVPFRADGKTHLVYELHITNFSQVEILLSRIDVLTGETTLGSFEGTELNAMLARPGTRNLTDARAIAPGLRAIAYMWVTLPARTSILTALRHRITVGNQAIEVGTAQVSTMKPIIIGPPLRGADWVALNGPSNGSVHRRALIPLNGKVQIGQRYAIDWTKLNTEGRMFTGDEKDNKSYFAYGNEVLAVADGVVASMTEGIPENVPGLNSRAAEITPETIAGNSIILDIGDGHFACYAHLQTGSLRVKKGDHIRRGQVLGLVGNSGNATGPHLHFQVADRNSFLQAEGLPYAFDSFEVQDPSTGWQLRRNEIPLANVRVRFPDSK